MSKTRLPITNILQKLNTVIEVDKIFPRDDSPKISVNDLKTIGIQLNEKQALELAAYLTLAVSDGWKTIDMTGYRERKKNGLCQVTITTMK